MLERASIMVMAGLWLSFAVVVAALNIPRLFHFGKSAMESIFSKITLDIPSSGCYVFE
jgi:hypothetical protein